MFRYRIVADERTSVDEALLMLRTTLDRSSVSESARALAITEVSAVLGQFVADGRKLAAAGSQLRASRDVSGDGYLIHVAYMPAAAKSWLTRLLGR